MKKAKYLGLTLLLAVTVCGCKSKTKEMSLYEKGLQTVEHLEEMVQNDAYLKVYTVASFDEIVSKLKATDYSTPKAVYKVTMPDDLIENLAIDDIDVATIKDLPDDLKDILNKKIFQAVTTRINANYGTTSVAASSIFMDNQTFVNKAIKSNVSYVYLYEGGYPVVVDFIVGDDHTVSATGRFLMTTEYGDSQKEMEDLFKTSEFISDIKIEKVEN